MESSADLSSLSSPLEVFREISKLIATFSYDRAKDVVEKSMLKFSPSSTNTQIHSFFQILSNLIVAEKQYMNLSFLAPKSFLRKEFNVRGVFTVMQRDLSKYSHEPMDKCSSEIGGFIKLRIDLIDFYEKLSILGTAKNVEVIDLLTDFEMITIKYSDISKDRNQDGANLITFIGYEINSLSNLLKSHAKMQYWEFFNSLITLQEAQKWLGLWADSLSTPQSPPLTQGGVSADWHVYFLDPHRMCHHHPINVLVLYFAKKSSFLKSSSITSLPCLYTWLLKLRASLHSKFSLYFYEVLSQNSSQAFDMKTVCSRLQSDYYVRLTNFSKKSNALYTCLIFDASDIEFRPNGYQHPLRVVEKLKGINMFPSVLSIPSKPSGDWPSVVMILNNRMTELNSEKLVGLFDCQVQKTYFIYKIDFRMFILGIYEGKKSEKDSYIYKFMQEFAIDLKCSKIFSSLKSIAK